MVVERSISDCTERAEESLWEIPNSRVDYAITRNTGRVQSVRSQRPVAQITLDTHLILC
jgi:hypothetical protein